MAKKKAGYQLKDDWSLTEMITGTMRPDKKRLTEALKRDFPQAKRIAVDEGFEMLMIENYKSMKGVPTKNLKLRLSMAKYLLDLIRKDVRGHDPSWYPEPMRKAMIMDIGTRLKDIIKELEGK